MKAVFIDILKTVNMQFVKPVHIHVMTNNLGLLMITSCYLQTDQLMKFPTDCLKNSVLICKGKERAEDFV